MIAVDASAILAILLLEPEAEAFNGDCFAYASATRHGHGLLFKGDDFTQTDIASALP